MDSCGIIYVADGADYLELACNSARSVRSSNPGLPVDLFCNLPPPPGLFDLVHPLRRPGPRAKLTSMQDSRFDRTLYLDTDTLVVGPIGDLWSVLDRFDCALAHDMRRASALVQETAGGDLPYAFPQLNSGVLLYRLSDAMRAFLAEWERRFHATGAERDQPILRQLLWDGDLRFFVLAPEFNLRRLTMMDAWEPLDAAPTIIHSHRLMDHMTNSYARKGPRLTGVTELLVAERLALAEEWHPADGTDPVGRFAAAQARLAES